MEAHIRQAQLRDLPQLTTLLLEACNEDPLHRLLEPRQSCYPQDTYQTVYRGVRNKLLNDKFAVHVMDIGSQIVGIIAWNLRTQGTKLSWMGATSCWLYWLSDSFVDLFAGSSRSGDTHKAHEMEEAADAMISSHAKADTVLLEQLAIRPPFQRRGYGSKLITHSLHEYASVLVASSSAAEKLYERHGFVKVGVLQITGYEESWLRRDLRRDASS